MFWFKEEEPEPEFWQVVVASLMNPFKTNFTLICQTLIIIGLITYIIVDRFVRKSMSESGRNVANNSGKTNKPSQFNTYVRTEGWDSQQNGNGWLCRYCDGHVFNRTNDTNINNDNAMHHISINENEMEYKRVNPSSFEKMATNNPNNINSDYATHLNENEIWYKRVNPSINEKMATNDFTDNATHFYQNEIEYKRVNPSTIGKMATNNEDMHVDSVKNSNTIELVDGINCIESNRTPNDGIDSEVTIDKKDVVECNPTIISADSEFVDLDNRNASTKATKRLQLPISVNMRNIWTKTFKTNAKDRNGLVCQIKPFDPGG